MLIFFCFYLINIDKLTAQPVKNLLMLFYQNALDI